MDYEFVVQVGYSTMVCSTAENCLIGPSVCTYQVRPWRNGRLYNQVLTDSPRMERIGHQLGNSYASRNDGGSGITERAGPMKYDSAFPNIFASLGDAGPS